MHRIYPFLIFSPLMKQNDMLGKVSRVSHRSIHARNQQSQANYSYLHWYKSHHNSVHGAFVGFHTEESDNEFVVEDDRYVNHCLSYMCNPYVSCYLNTKKIRAFRHYIQGIFEETFGYLRWIDLPGGQHQIAVERNYLMNFTWLIGFMVNELDTANNKDAGRQIRYRLEELICQAENLGIVVQKFFKPLQTLVQHHSYIEDMGDILTEKVQRPPVEKKIIRLAIKPDTTLFGGNKVTDFNKLFIYVRKDIQNWSRFKLLADAEKLDLICKSMMQITDHLKELQVLLLRPLRALKHSCNSILRLLPLAPPTLTVYLEKLRKDMKSVVRKSNYNLGDDDRHILESLLSEISSHYQYVMRYGEMLVEEIWDIILMARLSYTYISENPHQNITAVTYDAILMSRFGKAKLERFLKPSNFSAEDFYRVDCPDTLRKLPVVVSALNAEISLHLQGHRNTTSAKITGTMHKFSQKRFTARYQDDNDDEDEDLDKSGSGEKLLFVSADGDV